MKCKCGCGLITLTYRGHHRLFINGHQNRGKSGNKNSNYKGGTKIALGYSFTLLPTHPYSDVNGYIQTHRLIAEKAAGHFINKKHTIHHFNGIKSDNTNSNLVVCENEAYHKLLHQRKIAKDACGNASWLKCCFCKEHDSRENMFINPNSNSGFHRKCHNKYERNRNDRR